MSLMYTLICLLFQKAVSVPIHDEVKIELLKENQHSQIYIDLKYSTEETSAKNECSATGRNCDKNIDNCADNPCDNKGTCIDRLNDYVCQCQSGYTGRNCEENIDDCVDNPCVNGGACIDKLNDYECQCQYGYSGPTCEDFEGSGSGDMSDDDDEDWQNEVSVHTNKYYG